MLADHRIKRCTVIIHQKQTVFIVASNNVVSRRSVQRLRKQLKVNRVEVLHGWWRVLAKLHHLAWRRLDSLDCGVFGAHGGIRSWDSRVNYATIITREQAAILCTDFSPAVVNCRRIVHGVVLFFDCGAEVVAS